jgi:hypothetical protein
MPALPPRIVTLLAGVGLLCGSAPAVIVPPAEVTDFNEIGLAAAGFVRSDGTEVLFPSGVGHVHDEATGARVDPTAQHLGQPACFMHGPYRGGTGDSFQEFILQLPAVPAGVLTGLTALAAGAEQSDGVTFRVRVNDTIAWSEHRRGSAWQPFAVDLARWTGHTVRLRFEVSPGPAGNSSFDWALWGGRRLLLPGYTASASRRPDPPPLDLARLSSQENGSWAPLSGFAGETRVDLREHAAVFTYRGADGELAYTWIFPTNDAAAPLGRFTLRATLAGDTPVEVPLGHGATLAWDRAVQSGPATAGRRGDVIVCTRTIAGPSGPAATLTLRARLEQKSLVLEVACDQPWLEAVDEGDWGPVAFRRRVAVPYCGPGPDFLPAENLFVNRFPDWTASGASTFHGARAVYLPLTDGTRHAVRERFIFSAAWHLAEVLPNIPNPASPWRADLARRLVLDVWDGRGFDQVARSLDDLARVGVRDGLILLHIWQRDGYDNALPAHVPARAAQGGEAAMRELSATAKRLGYRLALHENYVDYYPNYEHFTTNDVSLNATGGLIKAWLNEGTGVQSFAVKPSAILHLSREQSPEIHRRYDTTASYLDVHSCVEPWFHVDQRAGEPGAGTLSAVWNAHRALWAYHRKVHAGPATGEGNRHWLWSGWLDGVEAQFGTGWPNEAGRTAPLLVDFNLLRIHPLQLNHGQGYYDRWHGKTPPWGDGMPMAVLDQYRMQEVVFGHAGFLGHGLWRDPAAAWLEQHLVGPVTVQHAEDRVARIRYFVDGRWVDTTAAAKLGRFDRVQITYARGLTITANGADDDWTVEGWRLPAFGWIATNRGFTAGTVRKDGVVVDLVESPDYRMAHARPASAWRGLGGPEPVTVQVAEFQALPARPPDDREGAGGEDRKVRFSYRWKSGTALTRDLRVFVHFDVADGSRDGWKTVTQQDHRLPQPGGTWSNGTELVDGPYTFRAPEADGRYAWFIGLWDDAGRLAIEGADDGGSRIRLGDLVVAAGGQSIRFEPAPAAASRSAWFRRHLNGDERAVDFGFVKTAGGVVQRRVDGVWRTEVFSPAPDTKP